VLALAVLLALTVPRMWQRGMFLDGVTYAVLARNLAAGEGTFWVPSYSATVYRSFFEQPPLGVALQAAAFALFGDHPWVERGYSVVVLLLHGLVIAAIWRRLLPRAYDWLPVLFWVIPSIVTWGAVNNMLENTQSLFTSLAVYLLFRGAAADSAGRAAGWGMTGAGAVAAAALVKGPVGLFPLVVPLLFVLLPVERQPKHWSALAGGLLAAAATVAAALAFLPASRDALLAYFDRHLFPALDPSRGGGWSVADVSRHLSVGILARLAAAAGLLWLVRRRGRTAEVSVWRPAAFFLATGLSASLPLLVSQKMAGHYFIACVPFFALASGAAALPAVLSFRRESPGPWARRVPLLLAGGLLVAIPAVLVRHGTLEPRNRDLIAAFDRAAGVVPAGATVGTCRGSAEDWGLVAYAQRFMRLSLTFEDQPANEWFLRKDEACAVPAACTAAVGAPPIELYRCAVAPGRSGER
jgi:4-amino-4-deoxy-L-arabinose transferase-like glycosyltransferase